LLYKIITSGPGKLVLTLLGIAIIYGVINLFLVGGQELWHSGDKKKLEEMKIFLDSQIKVIKDYEDLNKSGRITDKQYQNYSETLDMYNAKVKQYNELAKDVGTTWYVVPIPGGKH
jgi:predicted ATPase